MLRRLVHRACRVVDADREAAGEEEEGSEIDRKAAAQALLLGQGKHFGDDDSKVKEALASPERAAALARRQAE